MQWNTNRNSMTPTSPSMPIAAAPLMGRPGDAAAAPAGAACALPEALQQERKRGESSSSSAVAARC